MNSHPATYYHYEPLHHFGVRQVRLGSLAKDAVRELRDLMFCNYNNLEDYLKWSQGDHFMFLQNSRLWKYCNNGENPDCWTPEFLNKFCSLFPFQVVKTVRLRMKLTKELVEDTR